MFGLNFPARFTTSVGQGELSAGDFSRRGEEKMGVSVQILTKNMGFLRFEDGAQCSD